jgi:hypothetical protein
MGTAQRPDEAPQDSSTAIAPIDRRRAAFARGSTARGWQRRGRMRTAERKGEVEMAVAALQS